MYIILYIGVKYENGKKHFISNNNCMHNCSFDYIYPRNLANVVDMAVYLI